MKKKLEQLKKQAQSELDKITDLNFLNNFKIKYLGRKGELAYFAKEMKKLSDELRPEIGKLFNETKEYLQQAVGEKMSELGAMLLEEEKQEMAFDYTMPGHKPDVGHLHPITQVVNELTDIFHSMGFMVLDGPEVESDYYNFEALNIPKDHPARDMQDTFYTTEGNVLRTHTSPVQVRALIKYGAPIRAIGYGNVFRNEATDASHETTFSQVEGLMVDKEISISNLIAVMKRALQLIFQKDIEVRLRPSYYPFVEPGFDLDVSCSICSQKGCSVCKKTGWIEVLGCGMVHSNVLRAGKVDPKKYSGFAFGLGLERLIMLRYGIDDIRLFRSGDMRFLEQF